jgi:hypothetical protein
MRVIPSASFGDRARGMTRAVAVCCLLGVLLMADPATALERIFAPVPPPIGGALAAGPYNFQFTGEDFLRLTVFNSLAGVAVGVHYRTAPTTTTTQANKQVVVPTSNRLASTLEFSVGDGYLLNVVAFASSGSPKKGQCYVKLEVIRGRGAAAIVLGCVIAGYVTANQPIAWPGSPIESSTEGDGYARVFAGTDPPPGNDWGETVPTNAMWEIQIIRSILGTDATVVNRTTEVDYISGGVTIFAIRGPNTIPASTTGSFYFAQGISKDDYTSGSGAMNTALPAGVRLHAGDTIRSVTSGFQVGDDYSAPVFLLRELLDV